MLMFNCCYKENYLTWFKSSAAVVKPDHLCIAAIQPIFVFKIAFTTSSTTEHGIIRMIFGQSWTLGGKVECRKVFKTKVASIVLKI
jgi:hypothetical protein